MVTICSSARFFATVRELARTLRAAGIETNTPRLEGVDAAATQNDEAMREVVHEFLEKIRRCTRVYVIAHGGYVGRSVSLEVGFAAALGKEVLLSEPAEEVAIRAVTDAIVPPSELPEYLRVPRRAGPTGA